MTLNKTQFQQLAGTLAEPGEQGFSVSVTTGKSPRSGYMVSEPDTEGEVPVGPARPIVSYARQNKEALTKPGSYLGGWKPAGSDTAFLDRSRQMPGTTKKNPDALTSAMDIALGNRQEAIYDVKGKRSITSPDWKHFPRER